MTQDQIAQRVIKALLEEAFEEVEKIEIGHLLAINGKSNMHKKTHNRIKDKVRVKLYELMGAA